MGQQIDINNGRGESASPQGGAKSPEQIKEEIARTRSALSQDVAALGEKLSPERLKENAREAIHEAAGVARDGAREVFRDAKEAAVDSLRHAKDHAFESITETVHDLGERAQQVGYTASDFFSTHALPLSLLGLGAGWLLLSVNHQRRLSLRAWNEDDSDWDEGTSSRTRDAASAARERVGAVASRASHALSEQREHLMDRAGEIRSQVARRASDVQRRASELGHQAYERVGQAGRQARDFSADNPLAVGLFALAAGIGVGLLLPATRRERELLGDTRERWVGSARRTASELGRSVQRGASELKGALSE